MSIMDMFRTKPATPVDPSVSNPTVPGSGTPGNKDGTAPAAFPVKAEGDKSPLAGYEKLWDNDPNAKPMPSAVPTFNVDPKKLMDAARGIDFSKAIPADLLEKAAKGDTVALGQAISAAAQAGYAQSAHANTQIVKEALTQQAKVFKDEILPQILRNHSVSQTLQEDSLLTNTATAPLVEAARTQIAQKYPNASAAEIAKQTQEYFRGFAEEIVKAQGFTIQKPSTSASPANSKEEDWGKFFDVPVSP